MALDTQITNALASIGANAEAAEFANGYIKIYSGTKPATADTALSGNTLLATLRFGATAFGSAVNGVLTANAITADTDAAATGTASFFRCFKSDGTTALLDGTVGTASANMILATTSISQHQTVSCSSFTHTVQKSTSGL
jgi:hypothetical protein